MYQVLCWTTPTPAHPKWKNKIESENTNAEGEERANWGRRLRGLRSLRWWGLSLRPSFWSPHSNPPPLLWWRPGTVGVWRWGHSRCSQPQWTPSYPFPHLCTSGGRPASGTWQWTALRCAQKLLMVVLLPMKVTTILRPWEGMLQMAILTLLGIHSKK